MRLLLTYIIFLGAVHLGSSYAIGITTTVFVDIFASSTVTVQGTTFSVTTFSLIASAKAVATPITNSSNANINVTLPSLPLDSDSLSALDSLMNLILSVPDEVFQAGDADVVEFYTNISSCLANVTLSLEAAASNLVPEVASIAHEVGSDVVSDVGKATSFIGSLTSDIPGAISTVKSIAQGVGSDIVSDAGKATSLIASLMSDVPGAISTAKSIAQSIESQVVSAAPAVITKATSIFNDVTSDAAAAAQGVASALHLPFKPRARNVPKVKARQDLTAVIPEFTNTSDISPYLRLRSKRRSLPISSTLNPRNLTSAISEISTISACISAAATTNPLFPVADCAFRLAELVGPAAKLLKIKDAAEGAGGAVKIIQTLGNAADAASVVKLGGQGVLNAFKELLGINSAVDACKFLV
ncbi:uncharacterized protein LY89DRAFT_688363 [Mollisia scopiformis]|uniref:Uncharacterized protein n=1 Tax=Mollisia scopiformis TaxID=149040 RepID=A0A194WV72_MOLSC|nr:uncharacterized protein LY89DRAFT_688363 [Mollisia scopiformis]KUJ11868.1 hypothetical protein LY89DRAFT_688363 [Mollisia scopiformis]